MRKEQEKEEKFMEPFGDQWKKEMMQKEKTELVNIIKKICIENVDKQFEIRNLKRSLSKHENRGALKKNLASITK